MSISLAAAATSQLATADPVSHSSPEMNRAIFWICITWACFSIVALYLYGAFRRRSIVGPARLAREESSWDLLLVLFLGFFCGISLGGPVVKLFLFSDEQKELQNLVLNGSIGIATFISIVFFLSLFRPGALHQIGLRPKKIAHGLLGGGVTLFIMYPLIQLTGAGVEFVYTKFHLTQARPHELLLFLGQDHSIWITMFAITLAVVIAPFMEELMYRGLLQTIFARMFSWMEPVNLGSPLPEKSRARWLAVIATSIIFAASHHEPAFFAPLFVLALGLGYVYERTGNLWITITCHGLFNAAQIMLSRAAMH